MVPFTRRRQGRGSEEEGNERSLKSVHVVVMSWMGISVNGYTEKRVVAEVNCEWCLLW